MTDLGCTFTRNEMRARSVTNTHACNQTSRHKHWIVRGLGTAAQTYRTTLMHSHTGTTNMWLPQRPLSHVEQIHTNTVMSVCSSQPQAADLFIRNSAAEGQSEHSPVFFFFHHSLSWSINSDFAPTAGTRLFSASSDEMCESATTANTTGWFQSILAWFV